MADGADDLRNAVGLLFFTITRILLLLRESIDSGLGSGCSEGLLAPIALLAVSPFILVVNDALPAKNVTELVALAKAKPGALTFCSAKSGSVPHLGGELFKLNAKVDIVHVPYKGGGRLLTISSVAKST